MAVLSWRQSSVRGGGRSREEWEVRMSQDDAGETSPGQILACERPPQPDSPLDTKGCRWEPGALSSAPPAGGGGCVRVRLDGGWQRGQWIQVAGDASRGWRPWGRRRVPGSE